MATVEQLYRRHQARLSGRQRVRAAERLYAEVRDVFARRARADIGAKGDFLVSWETARRLYATDPRVRALLNMARYAG